MTTEARTNLIASKRSQITITEGPTIHAASEGSTVHHTVAVDGDVLGWVVEHRNANGKTIGWGVWGDQGPDGLFPGRDEAANWIVGL